MHLLYISRKLVRKINTPELISAVTKDDMERVQEHLSMKFVTMAELLDPYRSSKSTDFCTTGCLEATYF